MPIDVCSFLDCFRGSVFTRNLLLLEIGCRVKCVIEVCCVDGVLELCSGLN